MAEYTASITETNHFAVTVNLTDEDFKEYRSGTVNLTDTVGDVMDTDEIADLSNAEIAQLVALDRYRETDEHDGWGSTEFEFNV